MCHSKVCFPLNLRIVYILLFLNLLKISYGIISQSGKTKFNFYGVYAEGNQLIGKLHFPFKKINKKNKDSQSVKLSLRLSSVVSRKTGPGVKLREALQGLQDASFLQNIFS